VYGLSDNGDWTVLGESILGTSAQGQNMGWSVSISRSGKHVAAGAYQHKFFTGQVVIHRFTNGSWGDGLAIEGESNDQEWFGFDVDLGGDANFLAVGGPGAPIQNGVVRTYEWDD